MNSRFPGTFLINVGFALDSFEHQDGFLHFSKEKDQHSNQ